MTRAYGGPECSVRGERKVAVAVTVAPDANRDPGMVALTRSAPVGRPPLVARIDSVRLGGVAPHPLQKSWTSALVTGPVTPETNVWPVQAGVPKPVPVAVPAEFDWSTTVTSLSTTFPGLATRSVLDGTPVWKSAWVVSARHALVGAVVSEKSCVVVLPSVTTTLAAVLELYPGALAVMLG